ncbi:hypothetical protein [Psychrilyobacter atlanticus]|uniref:hypothetical protein n=1 Tax=Psychrilyobacter atlanticus TaxID=271091 RepID=UPI0003F9ABE1|nr:hypothetical protein [Psychrilyobacter atlanticus]
MEEILRLKGKEIKKLTGLVEFYDHNKKIKKSKIVKFERDYTCLDYIIWFDNNYHCYLKDIISVDGKAKDDFIKSKRINGRYMLFMILVCLGIIADFEFMIVNMRR